MKVHDLTFKHLLIIDSLTTRSSLLELVSFFHFSQKTKPNIKPTSLISPLTSLCLNSSPLPSLLSLLFLFLPPLRNNIRIWLENIKLIFLWSQNFWHFVYKSKHFCFRNVRVSSMCAHRAPKQVCWRIWHSLLWMCCDTTSIWTIAIFLIRSHHIQWTVQIKNRRLWEG